MKKIHIAILSTLLVLILILSVFNLGCEGVSDNTSEETEEFYTTSETEIELNPLQYMFTCVSPDVTKKDVDKYIILHDLFALKLNDEYWVGNTFKAINLATSRKGEVLDITFNPDGTIKSATYNYDIAQEDDHLDFHEEKFYYRDNECSNSWEAMQLYLANDVIEMQKIEAEKPTVYIPEVELLKGYSVLESFFISTETFELTSVNLRRAANEIGLHLYDNNELVLSKRLDISPYGGYSSEGAEAFTVYSTDYIAVYFDENDNADNIVYKYTDNKTAIGYYPKSGIITVGDMEFVSLQEAVDWVHKH